jgi:hypothetical protein
MAVNIQNVVVVKIPCGLVDTNHCFRESHCLYKVLFFWDIIFRGQDGTDRFSQNVGKCLPLYAA